MSVTATNTYEQKTIDIPVEKLWENTNGTDTWPADAVVTVALKNGNTTVATHELTADAPSYTFENLPAQDETGADIEYEVVEASVTGVPDNYNTTVSGNKTDGFTIKNTQKEANLTIEKAVVSDVPADANQIFTFTVKLGDTKINGTFSGVTFKDGVGTVEIKGSGSKTIEGLPVGTTYKVTEATVNYFTNTEKEGDEGTITEEGAYATFENTRDTTDLEVKKTVVNITDKNMDDLFTFTIKLVDAKINKTYSGVTFVDGEATIQLKQGQTKKIEGLPVGVKYTVTEQDKAHYALTDTKGDSDTLAAKKTSTASFVNTYSAAGEITFGGNKILENRDLKENEFEFALVQDGVETPLQTTKNKADGSFKFDKITYSIEDLTLDKTTGKRVPTTIKYVVKEVVPADEDKDPSIKYAKNVYEVEVTLRDNGDGTLNVVKDQDPTKASFTNTYGTKGDVTFEGKKVLENRKLAEGEFTFILKDAAGATLQTTTNKADGTFSFKKIEYSLKDLKKNEEGLPIETVINYTIEEDKPGDADENVTYDKHSFPITVTLNDNGHGGIDAEVEGAANITFTNTYKSKGQVDLSALKVLEGKTLEAGMFEFELLRADGTVMQTKSNAADGTVTFDTIHYDQSILNHDKDSENYGTATVKYTIREKDPTNTAFSKKKDKAEPVEITVTLEDDFHGTINATATPNGADVKFENEYKSNGKIQLFAEKILNGRTLEAGQFSFTLSGRNVDGAAQTNGSELKTNAADGKVTFTEILFTQDDVDPKTGKAEYTYTISEAVPKTPAPGYTYDETPKTIKVTLEDDGKGNITATANPTTATVTFTNTYEAKGEVTLEAVKVLEGKDLKAGQFNFEVLDKDGQQVATGTNDKDGKVTFTTIKYTEADVDPTTHKATKTYTVKEIIPDPVPKGYIYDASGKTVTVTLTDDGKGTIDAVKSGDGEDATFTNKYGANGEVILSAYKELKGRTLEAGQFTFVLKDSKGATIDTKTNDANGNVVFKTIAYTQADVKNSPFTYTIEETPGTNTAYTYAENKETITVKVVDNGDSTITATPDKTGMAVKFTNTYAANGKVKLSAKKKLKGKTLEAGEFTFKLKDSEGNVLDTKTNAADGTVEFAEIAYTEADVDATTHKGTKTYTISEVNEGKDGYTYDKDVETITVTLKDDGNGTITATPDKNGAEVLFENEYKADGKVKLKAMKTTEGHLLANEQFTFQLKDADGVIETKKNAADGSVVFSEITYDQTDLDANGEATFVYTILEVNDRQKGWTYPSPLSKTITVMLKDQGNGKIKVTADPADFTVTFKNTYTAAGNVKLDAKKVLKGGELKAEQFTFELKEGNTVLQTVKNDKDGNISFAAIPYTQADITDKANGTGSKTYTISEVAGQETGYTYDSSVLTVNASLEDNDDGTITAKADKKLGDLTFTNRYSETHFSKTDMGGEEIEGAKIQILGSDGKVVEIDDKKLEWTSGSDGKTGDKLNDHVVYGLADGVYTMHEVSQPNGYTLAVDIEFEIKDGYVVKVDGKDVNSKTERKVTMIDELTKVNISKTDVTDKDNKEIGGAHIQIIENGKVIEEWDSVDGKTHTVEGLKAGVEYILRETVAPNGYTVTADSTFTIDDHGKVTATTKVVDKNGEQVVLVQDTKTEVKVSKTDIASGEELEGATIQILDDKGKVVAEWTSAKDDEKTEDVNEAVHVVEGLKTGVEYTLKETVAPDGYTIAAETKFTIDEKGKVTSTDTYIENGVLLVQDTLTEVHVSKVDVADGDELEGATIQIIDKDGKVVEEWTSVKDDETTTDVNEAVHVVQGLKTGEEYTLKETVAPNGYTIAAETKFTIDEKGKVTSTGTVTEDGVMLVEDALSEVHVSKTDVASGEELEGATIQIIDNKGDVVETWISGQDGRDKDGKIKEHVVKGLTTGVEYTLKETVAPDGYTIAAETKFTIDEKGKVTSTGTVTEGGVVLVEDALTSVTISKVDVANGEEVEGAHIQILDKDGNVVEEWDSEKNGGHEVKGLKTGETYTLKETVAPNGYDITTETTFVLDENGKVDTTTTKTTTTVSEEGVLLVEDDRTTEVPVEKKLHSATGEEQILPNAQLRVVRVNADGSETDVESWTSGDAAHAVVDSTNNDPTNTNLKAGTYILYEDATPNDEYFQIADPITFTVDGLGVIRVNGEVVDSVVMLDLLTESGENWYESEKNKSNTDVDNDEENTEDDTEKDKESKKKKSTTTTTTTNTRTTSSTPTRSSGAKTADNTNAALPLAGGSVAILAILYLLLEEKKRRQAK